MNDQVLDLVDKGAWLALAAAVIGLLARAAKEDRLGGLFARVPVQQRPRVIAALGMLAGILDAVVRGTPWPNAIVGGVLTGALAMWAHGVAGGVNPRPAPASVAHGELPAVLALDVSTTADTLPPAPDTLATAPPELTLTEQHVGGSWGPSPRPSER